MFIEPSLMSDSQIESEIRALSAAQDAARYNWDRHARAAQREPAQYHTWLIMAGRGYGKTRTGAETLRGWARQRPGQYAVIAKSQREVLAVCFEAPRAGLLAVVPDEDVAGFRRGAGSVALHLRNGSVIRAFSAESPDALRGYAFDGVWCDEFSAWQHQTAQATLDMAWFCLREAVEPRMVVTFTPRNLAHVKALVKRAETDPKVVLTRGRTSENAANLSAAALAELDDRYGGTRLGRQELDGELLGDDENALFNLGWIESARVDYAPPLRRVVVAVDPTSTAHEQSDECGIVVAGTGPDGHDYVLADASARVAGAAAAALVWRTFLAHDADEVVLEGTSLWMLDALQDAYDQIADGVDLPYGKAPVVTVTGKNQAKRVRAEPVAAKYEQHRVHHVGVLAQLEQQMCDWSPDSKKSPDRLDALVHAIARLRTKTSYQATIATTRTIVRRIAPPAAALPARAPWRLAQLAGGRRGDEHFGLAPVHRQIRAQRQHPREAGGAALVEPGGGGTGGPAGAEMQPGHPPHAVLPV